MGYKENLVNLLSNIIHDKLNLLSIAKDNIDMSNKIQEIENVLNVDEIGNIDNDKLRDILKDITDEATIDSIISNINMIKIVINGKNNGLELSLDDSQISLIKGVYELVNDHRVKLDDENIETKKKLEDFISNCEHLSDEISSGVLKDIDTLDLVFNESNVSIDEIINIKFDILRNNNNNYNLNLDGKVKEEVDLRIIFKGIDTDLDSFSNIEKKLIFNYCNIDDVSSLVTFLNENNINLDKSNLLFIMLFSNLNIFSNVYSLCVDNGLNFNDMFKMPGVFISIDNKEYVNNIINEISNDDEFYIVSYLSNLGFYHENFIKNISLVSGIGLNIKECFSINPLMFVIPDMEKNITILSDMNLNVNDFCVVVINPYLATSKSSFKESGLGEYLNNNPIRLCTSYFRLRNIVSNIVDARKNGGIIFRSLSDKKNYWLSKEVTRDKR